MAEPNEPSVSIRSVFPWWLLAGAVATLVLSVAVPQLRPATAAVIFWGPMIGATIRERRVEASRRRAADLPPTSHRRWAEPLVAGLSVVFVGSIQLMVVAVVGESDPTLFALGLALFLALCLASGVVALIVLFRKRRLRSSSDPHEKEN